MSVPPAEPLPGLADARRGAPRPRARRNRCLALAASVAAGLGLALAGAPAAGAATHAAAAPATALHTYHVAPGGTDSSGSCTANTTSKAFPTIQDALACATSGDAISLAPTGATPYPGFGTVSQNITISAASGASARTVEVDETSAALTVASGATVTLTGVTLNGGSDTGSADVTNDGTLTLTRDTVTANLVSGGILNEGSLTLNATTVSDNVGGEGGGGITATGGSSLTADNSTIAGNAGGSTAGGVDLSPGATAAFVNSTITGNQDTGVVGGLQIWPGATATLSNTIIAGNTGSYPDCHGALTDGPGGHNLIGDTGTTCTGLANGTDGDQLNVSAGLLPLADNGGPTNTAALVAGSPAVGAGNTATCEASPIGGKDQRARSRNTTTRGCDIGAYDTGGKPVALHTYFVGPKGKDSSGSCAANTSSDKFPTIQDALACATDGDAISLGATGATPYPGFGTVSQNIAISAASGASARTVEVDETSAALTVASGSDVALTGVTLNGSSNVSAADVTNNGVLTLARDTVTGNLLNAGILNESAGPSNAELTLDATTVSNNVGGVGGGGIDSFAGTGPGATSLTLDNSTVSGNAGGSTVGGIDVGPQTTATFVNDTITGNQDPGIVGGLQVWGGATATLSNTIIAGNTGGYPDCNGALTDGPGGHNLIGDTGTTCTGLANGSHGDQLNVSAGLLPLADNGGPTDTAALGTGSPAIGAADPASCEQAPIDDVDQRGDSRNATTRGCDIGAYDTGGA